MVDLYNCRERYKNAKAEIKEWPIHQENKDHLENYLKRYIDHLSPGRQYADMWILRRIFLGRDEKRGQIVNHDRIAPLIKKPLSALTIKDFEHIRDRALKEIKNKESFKKLGLHLRNLYNDAFEKDESKRDILNTLFLTGRRRFFQWVSDTPVNITIDESKYYTYDEFARLLKVATRPQDRALLACAWESTARPNEYLSVHCGDVKELSNGFAIRAHISKKKRNETETRSLFIFTFRAEFAVFWENHPFKSDPKAPLFFRDDNAYNRGEPLNPKGANKIIKKLDVLSGVKKDGTLYFLRHGGYSWKRLSGMNAALAGKDMGWAPGASEERRYLHLREEELLAERLRVAGEHYDGEVKQKVKARACPFCNAVNSPTNERCSNCGQTLSIDQAMREKDQAMANLQAQMTTLMEQVTKLTQMRISPSEVEAEQIRRKKV